MKADSYPEAIIPFRPPILSQELTEDELEREVIGGYPSNHELMDWI